HEQCRIYHSLIIRGYNRFRITISNGTSMNFFNELKRRASGQPPVRYPNRPEPNALKEALDAGQRLKRAENYPGALEALTSAMQLAISSGDASSMTIIALNQAD